MRDRLVFGCKEESLREKFFKEEYEKLTFEKAVAICSVYQSARRQMAACRETEETVHAVAGKKNTDSQVEQVVTEVTGNLQTPTDPLMLSLVSAAGKMMTASPVHSKSVIIVAENTNGEEIDAQHLGRFAQNVKGKITLLLSVEQENLYLDLQEERIRCVWCKKKTLALKWSI